MTRILVPLAVLAAGCPTTSPAPSIGEFKSTPATIHAGETATLSWTVTGASKSASPIDHPRYDHTETDVSAPDYRERLRALQDRRGPLDACIYCAGIGARLADLDLSGEAHVFRVNLVGAVLTAAVFRNRRMQHLEFATRFGAVRVEAQGFVDSSGDACLSYEAGLEVREPDAPVFGSLNFLIEGYDTEAVKDLVIKDVHERLTQRGDVYGLVRHDGFLMHFPGKDFMLANVTHLETPLDPLRLPMMKVDDRTLLAPPLCVNAAAPPLPAINPSVISTTSAMRSFSASANVHTFPT